MKISIIIPIMKIYETEVSFLIQQQNKIKVENISLQKLKKIRPLIKKLSSPSVKCKISRLVIYLYSNLNICSDVWTMLSWLQLRWTYIWAKALYRPYPAHKTSPRSRNADCLGNCHVSSKWRLAYLSLLSLRSSRAISLAHFIEHFLRTEKATSGHLYQSMGLSHADRMSRSSSSCC